MFTGIVQAVGTVSRIRKNTAGLKVAVECGKLAQRISGGDSVAVNGVCLTATRRDGETVHFDAVKETLTRTNLGQLRPGESVNLELAIRAGEPFGGHFVQGHIDGTGTITRKEKSGRGYLLEVAVQPALTRQMIEKGSIAIDGISLTLVNLKPDRFTVALIPHTLKQTSLGRKSRGDSVNLEVDIMGKWIKKIVENQYPRPGGAAHSSLEALL